MIFWHHVGDKWSIPADCQSLNMFRITHPCFFLSNMEIFLFLSLLGKASTVGNCPLHTSAIKMVRGLLIQISLHRYLQAEKEMTRLGFSVTNISVIKVNSETMICWWEVKKFCTVCPCNGGITSSPRKTMCKSDLLCHISTSLCCRHAHTVCFAFHLFFCLWFSTGALFVQDPSKMRDWGRQQRAIWLYEGVKNREFGQNVYGSIWPPS